MTDRSRRTHPWLDMIGRALLRAEVVIHYLIFINVIAISLETVKELRPYYFWFDLLEDITLIVFMIEYLFRVGASIYNKKSFSYVFSFMGIVDLISILPIFLPTTTGLDLRISKLLRVFQVFRIFKLYRYSEHLRSIIAVFASKKEDLYATGFASLVVLVFCSVVTYYFEKDSQPDKFTNIFDALYWGITTLTTIGYGDLVAQTWGGRIMASILAVLGVALVAIPSAILSAGFAEQREMRKHRKTHDPTEHPQPHDRAARKKDE